tara:strand:+ start:677 stop:889 length:213 start_codon:yes stop_codon:yes gene_type:complete
MNYKIKTPNYRNVMRRKFEPVGYHSKKGWVFGWIYKRKGRWTYFCSASGTRARLSKEDMEYVHPYTPHKK